MLNFKREDERRILAAEMNWLRLSGVSKLERRRNKKIRQELDQMITLIEKICKRGITVA